MTEVGSRAAFLGGALLGLSAAPAALAAQFESSFLRIETLVGIAGDEVDAFREDVLALSGATAQAPRELSEALFVVTSAGARGAEALDILEASARASAVGLGDTATIARTVTAAVTAFRNQQLSAADATDILTAAVREGNLNATELAGSLSRVLGPASAVGVSFSDVGAFIATFSRLGGSAAEAATALRAIFNSLIRPTTDAQKALAEVGLSAEGLRQSLRERGLVVTLQQLTNAFDGNVEGLARVIPNIRALTGVLNTVGAQEEEFLRITQSLADSQGILGEAFERVSEDPLFQFQQALAEAQAAAIAFGGEALPIFTELIQVLGLVVQGFAALPRPVQQVIVLTVAFGGALLVVGGTLALLIGSLIQVTAGLFGMTAAMAAARVASIALATTGIFAVGALAIPIVLSLTGAFDRFTESTSRAADQQERLRDALSDVTSQTAESVASATRTAEAELARQERVIANLERLISDPGARSRALLDRGDLRDARDFEQALAAQEEQLEAARESAAGLREELVNLAADEAVLSEASRTTTADVEREITVREQLADTLAGVSELEEESAQNLLIQADAFGALNDSAQENELRLIQLGGVLAVLETREQQAALAAAGLTGAMEGQTEAAERLAAALGAVNRAQQATFERSQLEARVRNQLRALDSPEAQRLLVQFTPQLTVDEEVFGDIAGVEFGDILGELREDDLQALADAFDAAGEDARRADLGITGVIDSLRGLAEEGTVAATSVDEVTAALAALGQSRLREQVAGLTRDILGLQGETLREVLTQQNELDAAFAQVAPIIAERLGVIPDLFRDVIEETINEAELAGADAARRGEGIGGLLGILLARRLSAGLDPGAGLIAAPGETGIGRGAGSGAENLITIEEINVGVGAQTTVTEVATGVDSGVAGALRDQT